MNKRTVDFISAVLAVVTAIVISPLAHCSDDRKQLEKIAKEQAEDRKKNNKNKESVVDPELDRKINLRLEKEQLNKKQNPCSVYTGNKKSVCEKIKKEEARKIKNNKNALRQEVALNRLVNLSGCASGSVTYNYMVARSPTEWAVGEMIRIVNKGDRMINVESTRYSQYQPGPLVGNLCPGGSITIGFPIDPSDPDWITFPVVAKATTSSGRSLTETRSVSMTRRNYYSGSIRESIWEINFRDEK